MIFEYCFLEVHVLSTETRPTIVDAAQNKFDECNHEAIMLIKLSDTSDQLCQVLSSKTTIEIQKTLKDLHETSDKNKTFFLKNQLFSIIMDEHMSLQEHLLKIKDIKDHLEAIGHAIEEEDMVVITLKSLPSSYEHFIETLNIIATNFDLGFPKLCTKLLHKDH